MITKEMEEATIIVNRINQLTSKFPDLYHHEIIELRELMKELENSYMEVLINPIGYALSKGENN